MLYAAAASEKMATSNVCAMRCAKNSMCAKLFAFMVARCARVVDRFATLSLRDVVVVGIGM